MYYTNENPPFDIGELKWRMHCLVLGSIDKNRAKVDNRYIKYLKYVYRNNEEKNEIISELDRYMKYFDEYFDEYESSLSNLNTQIHIMIFEYTLVVLNALKLLLSSGILIPNDNITCLSLDNKDVYIIKLKDISDFVYKVTTPTINKYEENLKINKDGMVRYSSIEIELSHIDLSQVNGTRNYTERNRSSFTISNIDSNVYTALSSVIYNFLYNITSLYIKSIKRL